MEEKKRIVPEGVEEVDSEDLEDVAGGADRNRSGTENRIGIWVFHPA